MLSRCSKFSLIQILCAKEMTTKVDSTYRKWSCSNKFLHEMHFITHIYSVHCILCKTPYFSLSRQFFVFIFIHFHANTYLLTTFFVVSTHTAPTLFFSCFALELQHYAVYVLCTLIYWRMLMLCYCDGWIYCTFLSTIKKSK